MTESSVPLERLIDELRRPTLYGGAEVTVHQTHISVVFVAGDRAFKLKKPVDFGFVDYSTPELRRHFCEEEVRLNRRLAPGVYRGVRSVVPSDDGYAFGAPDAADAVDWVVEMDRLDPADNFLQHLHAGTLQFDWLERLGEKMARFHGDCARGEVGRYGSFETVARNARENFSQSTDQVGVTVDRAVFDAARTATEAALRRLEPVITQRDEDGATCDTHGDLRLEHVYRLGEELAVIDCIEFNDAFRYSDPVSDIAFLVMDLRIRWADDLADAFTRSYFSTRPGGQQLLDFYVAYRSAVRAKVHGFAATEPELDESARERAMFKSRAHWLFAHATLAPPEERPALVIVGGLPGTGKSTLARTLADDHGFVAIDSDHVRKELAGVGATDDMSADRDDGIYTAEWTERTYAACLERALDAVRAGKRVAVSATFRDNDLRERFLRAAHAHGVCGLMLECVLPRDEVARRLSERTGDASDADLTIHDYVASSWETASDFVALRTHIVSTEDRGIAREQAAEALAVHRLAT